ncbi:hypothetical protein N7516_011049 [Penicillium verrucosum]|uniref:uncharacterized protein n=1 Tax=Penicillium verrucosum TaxID=60171 RepID=UPI0025455A29|nr:uncharacterized protein N7516_011049 [Penicillium verrucosum]KAJ5920191.1 hypothetical protein N7516_011049 [Penicillium verrucosum]
MPIPGVLMVTTSLNSVYLAVAGGRFLTGRSVWPSAWWWYLLFQQRAANYGVVLANGTVCEANAQHNSDLYWALKGGAFNFGIVTRFDLTTFHTCVGGGVGFSDPAAHSDPSILYNVTTGKVSGHGIYMHRGDDPAPATLKNFTDILSTFQDFRVGKTILEWEIGDSIFCPLL